MVSSRDVCVYVDRRIACPPDRVGNLHAIAIATAYDGMNRIVANAF